MRKTKKTLKGIIKHPKNRRICSENKRIETTPAEEQLLYDPLGNWEVWISGDIFAAVVLCVIAVLSSG